MRADRDKLTKIFGAIENRPPVNGCPLCGGKDWEAPDILWELSAPGEGKYIPFISISCKTCGNTFFINAIIAGVVDRDEPQGNQ